MSEAKKDKMVEYRVPVYLLCQIQTGEHYEDTIDGYFVMGTVSSKEKAEKFLKDSADYMDENIGTYLEWSDEKHTHVPVYTEEKGDPKPKRIQLKDDWNKFEVVTFENYPQFKYGYTEVMAVVEIPAKDLAPIPHIK